MDCLNFYWLAFEFADLPAQVLGYFEVACLFRFG
jgi:hypothetical protein